MKWIKKYSFFLMILITSLGYGTSKAVKAVETRVNEKIEAERLEEEAYRKQQEQDGAKANGGNGQAENGQTPEDDGKKNENDKPAKGDGQKKEENDTLADGDGKEGEQPKEKREFHRVEMDYLSDALFIGDSRTSTLYEYAGWDETDFFAKYGLNIWEIWEEEMDGKLLEQMLSEKQYGKIYIGVGVNELGRGTPETYCEQFANTLDKIRRMQPDAIIFLESIIHVSTLKDAEGTYINNAEINARNAELKKLADNENIFWIDANEVMDNPETNTLQADYTGDGVHLKVKYIPVWREFLLDHGI